MYKNNKGITLIALVITIIVMLILVVVTISVAINGGLFEQAGEAASKTNEALKAEGELGNGKIQIGEDVYNSIEEYINMYKGDNVEKISKETSYIGCYADVDGDKVADGIIYADLAFAKEGYYEAKTGLKDYYVSGTYKGVFNEEEKEVLTATGRGNDRFYVMALTDLGTSAYTWYENKDLDGVNTSEAFGTGKTNTATMKAMWEADEESKSSNDIWGQLTENSTWFVPSGNEWEAFIDALGVASWYDYENLTWTFDCGLEYQYWTSSQMDGSHPLYIDFTSEGRTVDGMNSDAEPVRLSATF